MNTDAKIVAPEIRISSGEGNLAICIDAATRGLIIDSEVRNRYARRLAKQLLAEGEVLERQKAAEVIAGVITSITKDQLLDTESYVGIVVAQLGLEDRNKRKLTEAINGILGLESDDK